MSIRTPSHALASAPRTLSHRYRPTRRLVVGLSSGLMTVAMLDVAAGQTPQTLNGPPVQVQPYVSEPGVPTITINTGSPNPFAGVADTGTGTGAAIGGTGSSGDNVGHSDALNTMLGTSFGTAAVNAANTIGVNPSALAATCVLESGCQNVGGPGTVAGAFQMTASTYTSMINAAVAQDPSLANQIVPGLAGQMDPATESIAASEYLLQGAQYLQAGGISDPTVLDVRGYYNFGPQGGMNIATAADTETMASALSMYTPAQLQANGITAGETVGQWRSSVATTIGNAASQSVLG
jgi:hypothetical protein